MNLKNMLNLTNIRKKKLLASGILAVFVGIVLLASFNFVDNQRWYWNIAPFISFLAVVSAAIGGLLVGRSLIGNQKRRLWLVGLGAVLGLAWIGSGTFASVVGFLGMNYLPLDHIGWDSYSNTHLVAWFHIGMLMSSIATGILAGFSVAFGLAPKPEPIAVFANEGTMEDSVT